MLSTGASNSQKWGRMELLPPAPGQQMGRVRSHWTSPAPCQMLPCCGATSAKITFPLVGGLGAHSAAGTAQIRLFEGRVEEEVSAG
ncbi:unnamed protein product [Lota lota]